MNLSKIEKCAKLIGYEGSMFRTGGGFLIEGKTVETGGIFNPLTNKSDLVDLMCAVGVDANWDEVGVLCGEHENGHWDWGYFKDHPDKQTALAHAVVDVACQIYDRQFGGE